MSKEQKTWDFVNNYITLLSRVTDAPREFQEAAALFLISAVAGLKWVFHSLPDSSIFSNKYQDQGKPLNIWFIIIGVSRITRKTTGVLRHIEDLLKEIMGDRFLLSKTFTPEFLVKEMSDKTRDHETHCAWVSDEIAWFFHQLRKKSSYMTSIDAILSTIYDGMTYTRGTIERLKEVILNPYLTCFLASTNYLPTLFHKMHIRLGFLNRFIFVRGSRKERKPLRIRPLTESERADSESLKDFVTALANKRHTTVMVMSEDVKQKYDSFEEEIEERLETEDLGIKEGYWGNLPNFAIRLSCIFRVSRMTAKEIKNHHQSTLSVESQDVERAIEYVWKIWSWFEEVVDIMQSSSTNTAKQRVDSKAFIINLLRDKSLVKNSKIIEITTNAIGVSAATVYNARFELLREKVLCSSKYGFIKLKEICEKCDYVDDCSSLYKDDKAVGGD
jgi:hypothetical protein